MLWVSVIIVQFKIKLLHISKMWEISPPFKTVGVCMKTNHNTLSIGLVIKSQVLCTKMKISYRIFGRFT